MAAGFFTSYARFNNKDRRLERVVKDLTTRVAQRLGRADEVDVCFFDQNDVDLGDKWEDKIADGVNEARVLICLTSPTYFNRPHCAKEFEVFRRRVQHMGGGDYDRHIVPIMWEVRGTVPTVFGRFQGTHSSMPKNYFQAGLVKLKQLRPKDYEVAIEALAEAIAQRVEHEPPLHPLAPRPTFDQLVSSFHNPTEAGFGVAVAVLHHDGANCDLGAGPVQRFVHADIDAAARSTNVGWRELVAGPNLAHDVASTSTNEVVVVLIPPAPSAIGRAAAATLGSTIPWHAMVATTSNSTVQAPGQTEYFDPSVPASLRQAAEKLFTSLLMAHNRAEPGARIVDPGAQERATADGIGDLTTRPQIRGPGGQP